MTTSRITRRQTLAGAAIAGVGAPLLAACGGDGGSADPPSAPSSGPASGSGSASPSTSPSSSPSSSPSEEASDPPKPPADALTSTTRVPQGGGTIFADEEVVVTQPTAGKFACFTAVCTHRGCVVSSVDDGTINCRCHGSRFSITDGSVVAGPATSGLGKVPISVQGGSISLS